MNSDYLRDYAASADANALAEGLPLPPPAAAKAG